MCNAALQQLFSTVLLMFPAGSAWCNMDVTVIHRLYIDSEMDYYLITVEVHAIMIVLITSNSLFTLRDFVLRF